MLSFLNRLRVRSKAWIIRYFIFGTYYYKRSKLTCHEVIQLILIRPTVMIKNVTNLSECGTSEDWMFEGIRPGGLIDDKRRDNLISLCFSSLTNICPSWRLKYLKFTQKCPHYLVQCNNDHPKSLLHSFLIFPLKSC